MGSSEQTLPSITPPTPATLAKYGMTLDDWHELLRVQDYQCPICQKVPSTGRFVIDHEHVRSWKCMPPAERRTYVRGLLCWFDNATYLRRNVTVEKLRNIITYLETYQARRAAV